MATSLSAPAAPVWQRFGVPQGTPTTFDTANGLALPLTALPQIGVELLLPRSADGDIGARVSSDVPITSGNLNVALSHIAKPRDDLGLASVAGEAIAAHQTAFEAEWTSALSDHLTFGISGFAGLSHSSGNDLIQDYSALAYNAVTLDLSRRDVFASGDTLNLFVRQPVAVIRGSATFSVETASDSGKATLSDLKLDFAPKAREIEIGFDYQTQGPRGETWSWSASHTQNAGNYAGVKTVNLGATVRFAF